MISGITFDEQTIKSADMANLVKKFSGSQNGITKGCTITSDGSNMYISDGYLLIQGRQIRVTGTHTVPLETVTTGELYCSVVLELDMSKENTETQLNQLSLKTITSSSGYPALTQQDLEDNPDGTYQYLLAQYHVLVSGVENFSVQASEIDVSYLRAADLKNYFKLTGTNLYITI